MTASKLPLEGRTAFIAGVAGGIGLAVAQTYQQHGYNVVISDVDRAASTGRLRRSTSRARRPSHLNLERFGGVDLVVTNAGMLVLTLALDVGAEEFRRVLNVNLTGAFLAAKVFAGHMRDHRKRGGVIFTASLFGVRGGAENDAYSASKFGIVGLTQCLAADLTPHGICVNCVCPGQFGHTRSADRRSRKPPPRAL
ncbi:MAG TPA: SDR family oxidoreductase [Roseiarcus sp.]|nr:SDR family oxidoreductase [Roseiarcus sp.]